MAHQKYESKHFLPLMEFYANSSMFFNFPKGLPLLEETFPVVITRDNAFCVQFCVWQWKSLAFAAAPRAVKLHLTEMFCYKVIKGAKKRLHLFFSTVQSLTSTTVVICASARIETLMSNSLSNIIFVTTEMH